MGNRKKVDTFRPPLSPEQVAQVAEQLDGKAVITRRARRSARQSRPFGSIVLDHHKQHARRDDCGPSCQLMWTSK